MRALVTLGSAMVGSGAVTAYQGGDGRLAATIMLIGYVMAMAGSIFANDRRRRY